MRAKEAAVGDVASDMTLSDDQRITRIGRFIRRTRIDELPQVINILLGQMSWIGPRPETIALSEWYEMKIPFYRYRHIVRPGITGWAQVKQGHVTSVDSVREKLEYDFYYVRNFSIWLDMLIVMQTFRVVLTGHGAK
jgi:lipopolysaccharide/colanic/teichoic acid biosynthesis glycosyltransferase